LKSLVDTWHTSIKELEKMEVKEMEGIWTQFPGALVKDINYQGWL
jgi:hypothetical protein